MATEGGWGWVVVFCSFYFHMGVGAPIYSLSVFYGSWVEDFNTGRGIASLVITLVMAMSMGSGPLAASLSAKFGYRPVVIVGAIMCAAGFFASCFVSSIYALMVFIGLLSGVGKGMQYLPCIALVAQYFKKKRSLVTGIATSGVGVGTFIFPPFLIWLEEQYTWRGAMLILSGLVLNMIVAGFLMRPVENDDDNGQEDEVDDGPLFEVEENVNRSLSVMNSFYSCEPHGQSRNNISACDSPYVSLKNAGCPEVISVGGSHTHASRVIQANEKISQPLLLNRETADFVQYHKTFTPNGNLGRILPNSTKHISNSGQVSHISSVTLCKEPGFPPPLHMLGNKQDRLQFKSHLTGPSIGGSVQHLRSPSTNGIVDIHKFCSASELRSRLYPSKAHVDRKHYNPKKQTASATASKSFLQSHVDILLANSIFDLEKADKNRQRYSSNLNTQELGRRGSMVTSKLINPPSAFESREGAGDITDSTCDVSTSAPICPTSHSSECECCGTTTKSQMAIYMSILRNPYFATFAVANLLACFTYLMPVVYIVDRAVDLGVNKAHAALAFSMYGAGNIFGRVALGWLADVTCGSVVLGSVCLLVCGVSTALSPLCGASAVLHGIYGLTFGTFIGGFVTLTPLILVELLGLAKVGQSYGLILLFQSVGFIVGTPLAGWIFDSTQSYTVSFIIHGSVISLAGILLVPLKFAGARSGRPGTADEDDDIAVIGDDYAINENEDDGDDDEFVIEDISVIDVDDIRFLNRDIGHENCVENFKENADDEKKDGNNDNGCEDNDFDECDNSGNDNDEMLNVECVGDKFKCVDDEQNDDDQENKSGDSNFCLVKDKIESKTDFTADYANSCNNDYGSYVDDTMDGDCYETIDYDKSGSELLEQSQLRNAQMICI